MMIPLLLQLNAQDALANLQSLLLQMLVYGAIPLLMAFAVLVRYSRTYFLEKQKGFAFKFAGEQLWLFYSIARYMSAILVVLVGSILFWPGLYLNMPVSVPFQPLGFDLFVLAFAIMLVTGINEDGRFHNTIRRLMLAGTSIYLLGTLVLLVCPQQVPFAQGPLYNSFSDAWMQLTNATTSQLNERLAIYSIYMNLAVFLACVSLVSYFEVAKGKDGKGG
ncbi:MAG: hypothetical protein KGI00_03195 [Candidatus Micrarchaeota archaeon]|nr:hypothetical protein [Candidatus Micrarchaeota archaeon]MDE1849711.1 hypothetical protein [Candidatus Micrarchaeota archaeon]